MKQVKRGIFKKASFLTLFFVGIVSAFLIMASINTTENVFIPPELAEKTGEGEWHLIQRIDFADAVGEATPGSMGWLGAGFLDYTETPSTYFGFSNNDSHEGEGAVYGYVDTDPFTNTELESNRLGYYWVRAKFDATTLEDGSWNYENYMVNITFTGDETINCVNATVNDTNATSDAEVSAVGANYIFIDFWFGDGVDGYRITADGTINVVIWIYAKY